MVPSNPTVLLVDDESLFSQSVRDALEGAIHQVEVHQAKNGLEALAALERQRFDLLVTDLQMPQMGGFELLVTLNERGLHIPTIVVTAHGGPKGVDFALSYGALAFVSKPVNLEQLVDLVAERLRVPGGGRIDGVSVTGFLQLLEMERKTCTLRVSSGAESGTMTFVEGSLVDARAPESRGDAAVRKILGWGDPILHLEPTTSLVEETIETPLGHLLMDAMRSLDEESRTERPYRRTRSAVLRELPSIPPLRPDRGEPALPDWTPERDDQPKRKRTTVANVNESMETAMAIDGAVGAALVDFESGLTLGTAGGGSALDIDTAAAGNTQVVRAKMKVMQALDIDGAIEDILITLEEQMHLIRPLEKMPNLFLYLAIDRQRGNLGMARLKLKQIEQALEF